MSRRFVHPAGAAILVVASLVLPGLRTEAATVNATASILDLTSSLLSLGNHQYLSDASTPFSQGFDASSTLQSYFFNNTAPNGDTSFASIDNTLAPLPQTSAGAVQSGQGTASVLWTFDWTALGSGTAFLDLEYLSSVTLADLRPGESAVASSFISVLLDGTLLRQEALNFFNLAEGNTADIANLRLTFDVFSGQTGTFTVTVASTAFAAPVPLPGALPLLGSALLALAGLRARRKRKV